MPDQDVLFIRSVVASAKAVREELNKLKVLDQGKWDAREYGDDDDFTQKCIDEGITKAELGAVLFDSANALDAVMANHKGNFDKII